MQATEYYRQYIQDELVRRVSKNPRYSTRAFAKALGIDVGSLSKIISGKQVPSYQICQTLLQKMTLSPREQNRFLQSVMATQKMRGYKRLDPQWKQLKANEDERVEVDTESWKVIADWYHGAILELTFVEDFQPKRSWIARKLQISETQADVAIRRLLALGLLKNEDGTLVKTHVQLTTADKNVTSAAHRKLQKQVIKAALTSLENDPIEMRNMTSMTMAIDPNMLPQAKKMIQEFTRMLCTYLESGKRKEVYQLGISLYPLSKTRGDGE